MIIMRMVTINQVNCSRGCLFNLLIISSVYPENEVTSTKKQKVILMLKQKYQSESEKEKVYFKIIFYLFISAKTFCKLLAWMEHSL